jgi:hypothetical protein
VQEIGETMSETPLGTVETLLESAVQETENPDISFKLRQALQLLVIVEDRHVTAREQLDSADLDEDVRANLRELGYLD